MTDELEQKPTPAPPILARVDPDTTWRPALYENGAVLMAPNGDHLTDEMLDMLFEMGFTEVSVTKDNLTYHFKPDIQTEARSH